MIEKRFGPGTHLVAETFACEHLVIAPEAQMQAPDIIILF